MTFTFGIITSGGKDSNVNTIIDSIENQRVPQSNYEIFVIGNSHVQRQNTKVIWRPEQNYLPSNKKLIWLSRKRNIVAEESTKKYVVFVNDYFVFLPNWYSGWTTFLRETPDFQIGVNYVYSMEGPRHSDWVLCPYDVWELFPGFKNQWDVQLDPSITDLSRFQYISGNYWVATKEFSLLHPQNEEIGWGNGSPEDVLWCKTIRNKVQFKMNTHSAVKSIQPNRWKPGPFPEEGIRVLQRWNQWLNENL